MRNEFSIDNGRFVSTKGEYSYQDVLTAFSTARKIAVLTYNISKNEGPLMRALHQAPANAEITFLTNIPRRRRFYRSAQQRLDAQKQIEEYMSILDPEQFTGAASIFVCDDNHAKLIATDTVAYIGSENFSQGSRSNYEAGIITRDEAFLNYLFSELIPNLTKEAMPYYFNALSPVLLSCRIAGVQYREQMIRVHDLIYRHTGREDVPVEAQWYFDDTDDSLSPQDLSGLLDDMAHLHELSDSLYDTIDEAAPAREDWLRQIETRRNALQQIYEKCKTHLYSDEVFRMASFDTEAYTHSLINGKYSTEAYDEQLDTYMVLAQNEAGETYRALARSAEEQLEQFFALQKEYLKHYFSLLQLCSEYNRKIPNPQIDNTQQ